MGSAFLFAKDYLPEVEGPTPVTPFGRLRWPEDAVAPVAAGTTAGAIPPAQLPNAAPQASPFNALPAPPVPTLAASPAQGDDFTRIDLGQTSAYSMPGGTASVDRSRGLSGQAWLDSQRGRPASSFDAMVADAGYAAPPPISSLSRDTGEGPIMPGSERTLFTVGPGENAWIAGDIGARNEQERQRGVGINELLAELAQAKGRAGIAEAETLAEDPFARERMQGEIGVERDVAPILARSYGSQKQEEARRAAFAAEQEKIVNSYIANKARLQAEKNVTGLQELEMRFAADYQRLLQRFGVGAGVREAFEPPDPFSVSAGG